MPDRGTLLTGTALRAALDGRVFAPGSWSPSSVRGAGYDLRMSGAELIAQDEDGAERRYTAGHPRATPLVLAPGATAIASSEEQLCLDFDVAGSIGIKFSLAGQGLLVLTGTGLDPGFGRAPDADGNWLPVPGTRLRFVLANVGVNDIVLGPGDAIAYLQLFDIDPVERTATPSRGGRAVDQTALAPDGTAKAGGLAYFRNVADLKRRMDTVEADAQKRENTLLATVDERVGAAVNKVDTVQTKVDQVSNASNYVVVFGVFLVAVTMLAFALDALVDALAKIPEMPYERARYLAYAGTGAFVLAVLVLVWTAVCRTRVPKPPKKK